MPSIIEVCLDNGRRAPLQHGLWRQCKAEKRIWVTVSYKNSQRLLKASQAPSPSPVVTESKYLVDLVGMLEKGVVI